MTVAVIPVWSRSTRPRWGDSGLNSRARAGAARIATATRPGVAHSLQTLPFRAEGLCGGQLAANRDDVSRSKISALNASSAA